MGLYVAQEGSDCDHVSNPQAWKQLVADLDKAVDEQPLKWQVAPPKTEGGRTPKSEDG